MYIAYTRVSTGLQDSENQIFEIKTYCAAKGITIDKTITETISSKKKLKNRAISKVLSELKSGDTLVVTEISRIARKMYELMTILGSLLEKGVMVYSIKQKWMLGDDLISKVQAMGFALSADLERQLISQRTIEGLARVKANGKQLGRPTGSFSRRSKLTDHEEQIRELLDKKVSVAAIGRILSVHRLTVDAFIKKQNKVQVSEPKEQSEAIKAALAAQKAKRAANEIRRAENSKAGVDAVINALEKNSLQVAVNNGSKIWAYIRVSCDKQTNENQQRQIQQKADAGNMPIHQWCEEVISSRIPLEQRAIMQYVKDISANDVLMVSEISRLGRSQGEVFAIFELLLSKNVKIFAIRENYCFANNLESKTIIGCIAMAASIERDLISQRTKSALVKKRAEGVILGRPKGVKNSYYVSDVYKVWNAKKDEILAEMAEFAEQGELSEKVGITADRINAFCKKDFGVTYTEKCQQLTGCHSRVNYIIAKHKDLIQDSFKKGISEKTVLSKMGLGKASGDLLRKYCIANFGNSYIKLSNAVSKERKAKKIAQEKLAKVFIPRAKSDPNAKWKKPELLSEMSQVLRPVAIARLWGCHVSVILKQQKKFNIVSPMKRTAR